MLLFQIKPHEVVGLNIAPDNERMLTNFMESVLFIERKRFLVLLPDADADRCADELLYVPGAFGVVVYL